MTVAPSDVAAKRRVFRQLHESGCFVIPNPWDRGSASFLEGLGFKALATTSSGFAWSQGTSDGSSSRAEVLAHLGEMAAATELPINADFESGYGVDPEAVAGSVRLALATGVAGLSIEDSTGDPADPLRSLADAVSRLRAARAAIDEDGSGAVLIGRAENFFVGRPDLEDTIRRLKAYAEAGADCLYAPGIRTREQIAAVVAAVAPKPFNLLVGSTSELTLRTIAELGVRRISVGGALARSAWGGFMHAARALADGRFDGFAEAASGKELNAFFQMAGGRSRPVAATIVGKVDYREGDGGMLVIRPGPIEIESTAADVTISWLDGDTAGAAAMPLANFCQFLADGAVRIER